MKRIRLDGEMMARWARQHWLLLVGVGLTVVLVVVAARARSIDVEVDDAAMNHLLSIAWAFIPAVAAFAIEQFRHTVVKPVQAVQEQVQNTHSTNFRDDVDKVDEKVDRLDAKVDRVDSKVDTLADDVAYVRGAIDALLGRAGHR